MTTLLESIYARCIEVGECLEWQGSYGTRKNADTPLVWVSGEHTGTGRGRMRTAASVVWELEGDRTIPEGRLIYRSCANNRCLRHLKLGKHGDSVKVRGRLGLLGADAPSTLRRTKANRNRPYVVMSMDKAREVRRMIADGKKSREVAEHFGISEALVSLIKTGKTWRESVCANSVFALGSLEAA